VQGDMDITQYTGRLKQLVDALRDVGQPIGETSQVLNLLCGLSSKYRHAISVMTAKQLPHTFLSAHSYLLLEEHYDKEHVKAAAHHALVATAGARPSASNPSDDSSGVSNTAPRPPVASQAAPPHSDNNRGSKKCGHGRGRPPSAPRTPAPAWAPGLNPWTGMVLPWPMPFRVPGAGVLGPRRDTPANQAYFTRPIAHATIDVPPQAPAPDVWNHQTLLAALATAGVPLSGPQATEWFLDTGASSHISSDAANFTSP
jgi:hypothetical protein